MGIVGRDTMVEELHAFKVTGGGDFGPHFCAVVRRPGWCRLIVLANWSHLILQTGTHYQF